MAKEKSEQPQGERFKQAARDLVCDDDEAAFDAKLKKVAAHKPVASVKADTKKSDPKR